MMMGISNDVNQSSSEQFYRGEDCPIELLEDTPLFICHELRTPLTSIHGALGLLHTGQLGTLSEEGMRVLAIAINNANRLTRLANAIENKPALPMTILSEDKIEELQLENELHEAFDRQEFRLVYQPIISVENNKIIGFEALVRWQHPLRGVISPDVFIPLAEKSKYIHKLGLWILEEACLQLSRWQQEIPFQLPLTMSVNLSTRQLLQPNLVSEIQHILRKTGVSSNTLKLEITESTVIENKQIAIAALLTLRKMGIHLCVDDFGTGYSSLGRLQKLPINVLKIDRSFVQTNQWDICETVILLAQKLGLEVIAEGVETIEDLDSLKAVGCTKMQGYLFSKPLDSQFATALITSAYSTVSM